MFSLLIKYIKGWFKNFLIKPSRTFSLIDNESVVKSRVMIYPGCKICRSSVDDYTYVCSGTILTEASIGKFCSIGNSVTIGLSGHPLNFLSTSPVFYDKNSAGMFLGQTELPFPEKRTVIGNDVWIGSKAMIMNGKKVGNGAVIGAGAIVTKDIPPYAIAAGVPAKVIRYRFSPDMIEFLEKSQWWNLSEQELRKIVPLFQKKDITPDELRDALAQTH